MDDKTTLHQIVRVFPRKTKASPDDEFVFWGKPPKDIKADEAHISVTFTYDLAKASELYFEWSKIIPTKMGGPAFNQKENNFKPGMYLKRGYVITSRGCPNRCWFCNVWRRNGDIRELPIMDGWNVVDDNLLACSEIHIKNVFTMLKRQKHKAEFTGGFEARRLQDWHIDLLLDLKPKQVFFAYDRSSEFQPLMEASLKLREAGLIRKTSHAMRCFVLVGTNGDTFEKAEKRLVDVSKLGFMPMAMLYRNECGETKREWRQFQREWAHPIILGVKMKELWHE